MSPKIYICLPVLNESAQLPRLLHSFLKQTYPNFKLICCINQPDAWWEDELQIYKCIDNQKSLEILKKAAIDTQIIDKSTKGKGWIGKKKGVGWARKLAMDLAAEMAEANDLIVSVDADTFYPENYFESLVNLFAQKTNFTLHSNPYYHPLTGFIKEDAAILRYEIYMRVYQINMMLIDHPYAFTAIGSAMICTTEQYLKMGGISPKHSGEDFYFVQHMRKNGPISHFNTVKVYPQARFSDRVHFGTGPAMIKGNAGDWSSYPFYLPQQFQKIKSTYQAFELLYDNDFETPMTEFLRKQLKKDDFWQSLRKNATIKESFAAACMQLVDGLRILQFLKADYESYAEGDEQDLRNNLIYFSENNETFLQFWESIKNGKELLSLKIKKELRDALEILELSLRFEKPII